jgi:regulation of enolase protein 1 (concanavalin A-like superfamily)
VGTGSEDAYLELVLPEGSSHNPWKSNKSVRMMQSAANVDFEAEVKFASEPSQPFQMQGILVEQDANNWLRFDLFYDDSGLALFGGRTINGSSKAQFKVSVASGEASHLRVARVGDEWTLSYSADGLSWTVAGSFTQAPKCDIDRSFCCKSLW